VSRYPDQTQRLPNYATLTPCEKIAWLKNIELFLGNKKTVAKLFGGIPVENHHNTLSSLCQGAIFEGK
jgi:hypothetical protein